MKKRCFAAALACCLLLTATAMAQPLDFSGVVVKDGWLTGEINTGEPPFPWLNTTLYVDCAAPQALTDDQWVTVKMAFWKTTKKTITAVLKDAGTDVKQGKLILDMKDEMHRGLVYKELQSLSIPYDVGISGSGLISADPLTADMQTAVKTYQRLCDSLGVAVGVLTVSDYGQRDYPAYAYTAEDRNPQRQALHDAFRKQEAAQGRDPSDYVWIAGRPMLRGLPVSDCLTYPSGDAREPDANTCIGCYICALSDKQGRICHLMMEGIPQEQSADPLPGDPPDWRLCFQAINEQSLNGHPIFTAMEQDCLSEDDVTWTYAYRNVLASIEPVWVGYKRGELVPGYRFTVETRRLMDDGCLSAIDYYADMVELKNRR